MKLANATMDAESIFFYMTVTALLLIPVALAMTDFSLPINWGMDGPYLAAATQILNSVGALALVYAFRYRQGHRRVASDQTRGAPLITALLSILCWAACPPQPSWPASLWRSSPRCSWPSSPSPSPPTLRYRSPDAEGVWSIMIIRREHRATGASASFRCCVNKAACEIPTLAERFRRLDSNPAQNICQFPRRQGYLYALIGRRHSQARPPVPHRRGDPRQTINAVCG